MSATAVSVSVSEDAGSQHLDSSSAPDPLTDINTAVRWVEDNAYDVRITAVIMVVLSLLVAFYASQGFPVPTAAVVFFFLSKHFISSTHEFLCLLCSIASWRVLRLLLISILLS